jgi:hypothetical protein
MSQPVVCFDSTIFEMSWSNPASAVKPSGDSSTIVSGTPWASEGSASGSSARGAVATNSSAAASGDAAKAESRIRSTLPRRSSSPRR